MNKNIELVNLDVEANKVIALTHDGDLKCFTRQQLLELLDLAQNVPFKVENRPKGASLASIGNLASRLLDKAQKGGFSLKAQKKLAQAIESFNGVIKQRANSPAYYRLMKLKEIPGISSELSEAIDELVNKYPDLKDLRVRKEALAELEMGHTQVEKAASRSRKKK